MGTRSSKSRHRCRRPPGGSLSDTPLDLLRRDTPLGSRGHPATRSPRSKPSQSQGRDPTGSLQDLQDPTILSSNTALAALTPHPHNTSSTSNTSSTNPQQHQPQPPISRGPAQGTPTAPTARTFEGKKKREKNTKSLRSFHFAMHMLRLGEVRAVKLTRGSSPERRRRRGQPGSSDTSVKSGVDWIDWKDWKEEHQRLLNRGKAAKAAEGAKGMEISQRRMRGGRPHMATGGLSGSVTIDTQEMLPRHTHCGRVTAMAFSECGGVLATGCEFGQTRLWYREGKHWSLGHTVDFNNDNSAVGCLSDVTDGSVLIACENGLKMTVSFPRLGGHDLPEWLEKCKIRAPPGGTVDHSFGRTYVFLRDSRCVALTQFPFRGQDFSRTLRSFQDVVDDILPPAPPRPPSPPPVLLCNQLWHQEQKEGDWKEGEEKKAKEYKAAPWGAHWNWRKNKRARVEAVEAVKAGARPDAERVSYIA